VERPRLSRDQAVSAITQYVNETLAGRTYTYFGMYGQSTPDDRPFPRFTPDQWRTVERKDGRWTARRLAIDGPWRSVDDGLFVVASIAEFGSDPKIDECEWLQP
jgi:hypothetical protein